MNKFMDCVIEGADVQEFSRCFQSISRVLPPRESEKLKIIRGHPGILKAYQELNSKTVKAILKEYENFQPNVVLDGSIDGLNFKLFAPDSNSTK